MKKRIGIWKRVSTDRQEGSAENHVKRAQWYAKDRDWEVVEIYDLEDVSGKTLLHHPETHRMLRDIETGHIDGLIFSKLARLARNTRELLDFADFFKDNDADLISLGESIDTSTPAGRLFYTMLSAIAQWEREEIADRVASSIAIRAKMGKLLGGQAPYGYSIENGELVINEKEAPIRKLMFELFLDHKRKSTVAKIINGRGYRTRKGKEFSDVAITRNLKDTVAKGLRRMNYSKPITKDTPNGLKPKEEWVYHPVPAIVSEELWEAVNTIIEQQEANSNRPLNRKTHLFTGFLHCHNGHKMYLQSRMTKYSCKKCKVRIDKDDLEKVFQTRLKKFVFSEEEKNDYLSLANQEREAKKNELEITKKKLNDIELKMERLLDLHIKGEIPTKGFNKHYNPLFEQSEQLQVTIPLLEKEYKDMSTVKNSVDEIIESSKDLYSGWDRLSQEEKREVIEAITNAIVFDGQNLTFKLKHITPPQTANPFSELNTDGQQNHSIFD